MASFNLTLSPSQIEFVAKPDSGFTQAYNVTNNSQNSLILNTEVLPWVPLGDDGSVSYDQVNNNPHLKFSLANADLSLGQTFVLKPGEKRQLVLKVKSDATTPLADSYYTFFINQDQGYSLQEDGNVTSTSARIGSHILLSISPTENPSSGFAIDEFQVTPKIKDIFFPKIRFSGLIHNDSDYYNKINGKITITKNNLAIKELTLFPHNVLAHNSRQTDCLADKTPIPCTLDPPYWPGVYTATISLDSSTSVSVNFFVFPYTLLISCLLLGVLIYILFTKRTHAA